MRENLIGNLTSKNDRFACAFADKILSESLETDVWYEYFHDIAALLAHITDEKPITARQCIKCLVQVGKAKPQYIPTILAALYDADFSKYKDSMRPLLEKDRIETETILTERGW